MLIPLKSLYYYTLMTLLYFQLVLKNFQVGLDVLVNYCKRWKLKMNVDKAKIMVFRKGGVLPRNLTFYYNGQQLEIVNKFRYLSVIFTAGGSFSECQNTLAGQAQEAIFSLINTCINLLFSHQDTSLSYLIN